MGELHRGCKIPHILKMCEESSCTPVINGNTRNLLNNIAYTRMYKKQQKHSASNKSGLVINWITSIDSLLLITTQISKLFHTFLFTPLLVNKKHPEHRMIWQLKSPSTHRWKALARMCLLCEVFKGLPYSTYLCEAVSFQ